MSRLKRPLTDVWLLGRPKLVRGKRTFYGAYPAGFLERARLLLGVQELDPVLHVCAGVVRDYPFRGFGPNDRTVDLDQELDPDFCMDARKLGMQPGDMFPYMYVDTSGLNPRWEARIHTWKGDDEFTGPRASRWPAILADPPYSAEDAEHYLNGRGAEFYPDRSDLLKRCLSIVAPGGRVGFLDLAVPFTPKGARLVALIPVIVGDGAYVRIYSVFERDTEHGAAAGRRGQKLVVGRGTHQRGSRKPKRVMKVSR